MTDWVTRQVEQLRAQWPKLEYNPNGHWVRIPDWNLPQGWSPSTADIAFQIKPTIDETPYAFYLNAVNVTHNDTPPGNWSAGAQVSFPGEWSQFSWAPETWTPTANPDFGPNMVAFVRSFDLRFREGA